MPQFKVYGNTPIEANPSETTGADLEGLKIGSQVYKNNKQDPISDLDSIRSGANLGTTSVQDVFVDGTSVKSGTVVNLSTHNGAATLDNPMKAGYQYLLGNVGAAFEMVLPTSGNYNDRIEVIFKATNTFSISTSGGTITGDFLPSISSNTNYDIGFTWIGTQWLCQWLAFS